MTTSTPEPAATPAPAPALEPAPRKPPAAPDAAEPYIENPGPVWKMAQVLVRVTSSVWFDLKVFKFKISHLSAELCTWIFVLCI